MTEKERKENERLKKCAAKDRFLVWLMYAVPIALTGMFSLAIWTLIQIILFLKECEEQEELNKPLKEQKKIIEMNKEENLNEWDKSVKKAHPDAYKIAEGWWAYDRK